jgi:hypothetical protein
VDGQQGVTTVSVVAEAVPPTSLWRDGRRAPI